MSEDPVSLLRNMNDSSFSHVDRAVAALWLSGIKDRSASMSPGEIAELIHQAGYPRQNVSRLEKNLSKDKRTIKVKPNKFKIHASHHDNLSAELSALTSLKEVPASNGILNLDLFANSRKYIQRVVIQINGSYEAGLYDCCAVMCRRLLETLIIEAFEAKGLEDKLKGKDGNYLMFSGLLSVIENGTSISLGRSAISGLKEFKKIGDLSAHNRRFNARNNDITDHKNSIRIASEELLHIAGQS